MKLLEYSDFIGNLSHSNLSKLPEFILEWIRKGIVKELLLNNNQFNLLPLELRLLKNCSLSNNPLLSLPEEYRNAKWIQLKKFLDFTEAQCSFWNIFNLSIVGPERSGKSSL